MHWRLMDRTSRVAFRKRDTSVSIGMSPTWLSFRVASSSSDPDGHIETWLHRWAMYSRMSSGPSWSVERWKYCANYTPMLSEHGCERLSHDQPIVFSRP